MRFHFTDEQELLRRTARQFAERTLTREYVRRLDATSTSPHRELLPAMAALGFTALPVPVEYDGLGGGAVDTVILMEELGRASLPAAMVLDGAIGTSCELVKHLASDDRKRELFDALIRGEMSFALAVDSEPIDARIDSDDVVLSGAGILVAGANEAHRLIVAARTGATAQLFLLEPHTQGITYRKLETIGMRTAGGLYEAHFRDVRAPRSALLGEDAVALAAAQDRSRLHLAVACVGCAQQVIDEAVRYARDREQFGQPIGKFQAISHLLVDLQVDVDAARALVYRAAWTDERTGSCAKEAAMAKLACSEALLRVTSDAMRVYGGYGLTMEFDIQRHFRDARHVVVESGSSAGERARIAYAMGLR